MPYGVSKAPRFASECLRWLRKQWTHRITEISFLSRSKLCMGGMLRLNGSIHPTWCFASALERGYSAAVIPRYVLFSEALSVCDDGIRGVISHRLRWSYRACSLSAF
uniref:LysR_substrate domain-containing protein n=1 Tax=Steinernema glaseri TaxID=37863 RepID=A0A1I7YPQ4_9BILA